MTHVEIIKAVQNDIKEYVQQGDAGHDWWHMYRVANLSEKIAQHEQGADLFVVQLAAWLHDVADWKFHDGDEDKALVIASQILNKYDVAQNVIHHVCMIIKDISFKGAGVATRMTTLEGQIVQDADRLDAIGAIGVARTFVYGGFKNRPMHIPGQKAELHQSKEAYKKSEGTVINHFYEKLLLLKDRMNTQTGQKIAQKRHNVLQSYLNQFLAEWDCVDIVEKTSDKKEHLSEI